MEFSVTVGSEIYIDKLYKYLIFFAVITVYIEALILVVYLFYVFCDFTLF
jgi:hypothetical protein